MTCLNVLAVVLGSNLSELSHFSLYATRYDAYRTKFAFITDVAVAQFGATSLGVIVLTPRIPVDLGRLECQ